MSRRLRAEILESAEAVRHRAAWERLAARALEPNVFAEPAFALPAARHLGRGPRFAFVWQDSDLVAACAIERRRVPGLAARAFSHPQATSSFPLLDAAAGEAALDLLIATAGGPGLRCLGVPAAGPTAALFRDNARCIVVATRPRAVLTRDAPPAQPSKEMRRQERRLADLSPLRYGPLEAPDVEGRIERFLDLEGRGWKGRAGTAFASDPALTLFATEAVHGLGVSGQAQVALLQQGERAIAAALVLRSGDRAWFWKTSYDEGLARWSPGLALARRLTGDLLADASLALVDSCAVPDHPMIDRLWPGRMTVMDCVVGRMSASRWPLAQAARAEKGAVHIRATAKSLLRKATERSRWRRTPKIG